MNATLQNNRDALSRLSLEEKRRLFLEGMRRPDSWPVREEYLRREFMVHGLVSGQTTAIQNVHTPFVLAEEIVKKLVEHTGELKGQKILVYNAEFLDVLYRMGILWNNEVWFVNENPLKVQWAKDIYQGDENDHFVVQNWLDWNTLMKFDVIVGNPPYQKDTGKSGGRGSTLWDQFVKKSISLLNDGGHLCYVHPAGWRDVEGQFKGIQTLIKTKRVKYLEIHDRADGVRTFGVQTAYDWYILQNVNPDGKTIVKSQNGETCEIDLNDVEFIPNSMFDAVQLLMAKSNDPRCDLLSDCAYHTQRPHVSKEKSATFQYPCVLSILKDGTMNFVYSSTKDKGHFGISKLIFSRGTSYPTLDLKGEYGLSEFASAIIDTPETLLLIQKAMLTERFIAVMNECQLVGKHRYHRKAIALFRKDFWKQFVDENGNELK